MNVKMSDNAIALLAKLLLSVPDDVSAPQDDSVELDSKFVLVVGTKLADDSDRVQS